MKTRVEFERFLKHPPEHVWKAFTNREWLAMWYLDNDFEPIVGHKFQFRTHPTPGFDGIWHCEVTEVEKPFRLAYTFQGGWLTRETTVLWTLTPQNGGTLLRLEHKGFTSLSDLAASSILRFGWWRFLRRLPQTLLTISQKEVQ